MRGTSGASPRALRRDSLILMTFSKEEREVMEKTRAYPWTPTLAFRDMLEYSSCVVWFGGGCREDELLDKKVKQLAWSGEAARIDTSR